jgi:tRNA threonylcarbamoyladenosine biosynthesis protein TsaE
MVITTKSDKETIRVGEEIARHLKPGDMIALSGDLGSGKTTLVKGIAKGLGVKNYRYVNSPSFTIVKEYKGKVPLFHFDVYRLDNLKDIEDIGYEDYLDRDGVVVIEWSNKMARILPKKHLDISLKISGNSKRSLNIKEGRRAK